MMNENYFIDRACPFCGWSSPRFENYKYGEGYLLKCPECWAVTKVKGTWLAAYDAWNNEEWSEESIRHKLNPRSSKTMDTEGAIR